MAFCAGIPQAYRTSRILSAPVYTRSDDADPAGRLAGDPRDPGAPLELRGAHGWQRPGLSRRASQSCAVCRGARAGRADPGPRRALHERGRRLALGHRRPRRAACPLGRLEGRRARPDRATGHARPARRGVPRDDRARRRARRDAGLDPARLRPRRRARGDRLLGAAHPRGLPAVPRRGDRVRLHRALRDGGVPPAGSRARPARRRRGRRRGRLRGGHADDAPLPRPRGRSRGPAAQDHVDRLPRAR